MAFLVGQVMWLALAVAVTGILHMVVVMLDLFAFLKKPLDGGRSIGGQRVFGDNKTWRGVAFMVVCSGLIGFVQGLVGGTWAAESGVQLLDFHSIGTASGSPSGAVALAVGYALVNFVFGFGYALGELPNSFIKRRLDITPGKTETGIVGGLFFIVDQADSVVFAFAIAGLVFGMGAKVVITGIVCLTLIHLLINATLYATRIRKNL